MNQDIINLTKALPLVRGNKVVNYSVAVDLYKSVPQKPFISTLEPQITNNFYIVRPEIINYELPRLDIPNHKLAFTYYLSDTPTAQNPDRYISRDNILHLFERLSKLPEYNTNFPSIRQMFHNGGDDINAYWITDQSLWAIIKEFYYFTNREYDIPTDELTNSVRDALKPVYVLKVPTDIELELNLVRYQAHPNAASRMRANRECFPDTPTGAKMFASWCKQNGHHYNTSLLYCNYAESGEKFFDGEVRTNHRTGEIKLFAKGAKIPREFRG